MNWKLFLVREYGGHPVRISINLLILNLMGILIGHLFGVPLTDRLVMGAMIPGLVAIVCAAVIKETRFKDI